MAVPPHEQSHKSTRTKAGVMAVLRQKIAASLPPVWRGNHQDMPLLTHDRIWFLRESRFLFFTRNGPVEITLKPTVMLATALVGMIGVSVIFLSTVFASYSAIEVMRDESIQTAEAGITLAGDTASVPNTDSQTSNEVRDAASDAGTLWHGDVTLHQPPLDDRIEMAGKTATAPKPVVSRLNTRPQIGAPSPAELGGATAPRLTLPSSLAGGDVTRDTAPEAALPLAPTDITVTANAFTAPAIGEAAPVNAPAMDLALATPLASAPMRPDTAPDQTPLQMPKEPTPTAMTGSTLPQLPKANEAESGDIPDGYIEDSGNSFARSAAGFAIAMLPRFFSEPDASDDAAGAAGAPDMDSADEGPDDGLADPLDDGFASSGYSGRTGPLLPSISDAARAQKMLLSLDNEINYIRKSISQLGIKATHLPDYDPAHSNATDADFKELLITLAEHRAALRKIPFKTPMLYFYISSDYGYRKHPKTGAKTFHHGIDLAGTWQENVRATAPGTVVFAGREGSFGKVVRIEHEFGVSTLYAHLARITVSVGDYVAENTVIGKMGNTGRSAGAHLHYEIQVDGQSIDPSEFFTIGRQMSVSGELRQTSLTD
jgi:murein DD-endopeptidase MepM/ murein hydrolase activator NlpD